MNSQIYTFCYLSIIFPKVHIFPITTCFFQNILRSFVGNLLRLMNNYLNTTINVLFCFLYRVVIQVYTPPAHNANTIFS